MNKMSRNINSTSFILLWCVSCIFVSSYAHSAEKMLLRENENLNMVESFLDIQKSAAIENLQGQKIMSSVKKMNNFSDSGCMKKNIGMGLSPIILDIFEITEEISRTNMIKIDCKEETHYAQSTKEEDVSNYDTYHVQSDNGIYYIRPDYIAKLASPLATFSDNYPQWVFEDNKENGSFLFDFAAIMKWTMAPYIKENQYSIWKYISAITDYHAFSLDNDNDRTILRFYIDDRAIFKGDFLSKSLGKWETLAYYNYDGKLTNYLSSTYAENGNLQKIYVYDFLPGCEYDGDISHQLLKEKSDRYTEIIVKAWSVANDDDAYYDAYKQIKPHHTVSDCIKDEYYKASDSSNKVKLSSLPSFSK